MHSKAAEDNQNVLFQIRRVLLAARGEQQRPRLYSLDLDQLLDDVNAPATPQLRFHCHLPFVRYSADRMDSTLSCNGLLFVQTSPFNTNRSSEIYLVNPLGMKPKELPAPPLYGLSLSDDGQSFGLGFDYSTNQHKVVHLVRVSAHKVVFKVYTLETDRWLLAGHHDFSSFKPWTSRRDWVLVNGGVHWLIRDGQDGVLILGFMITEEKIVTIRFPEILGGSDDADVELGVFRDGLCIIFKPRHGMPIRRFNEFWVMKEYGVKESWTKMSISIPYKTLSHSGFWRGSYDLMKINTGNKSCSLVLYNFDDGEYRTLPITLSDNELRYGYVGVFVESLASVITSKISKLLRERKRKEAEFQRRLISPQIVPLAKRRRETQK